MRRKSFGLLGTSLLLGSLAIACGSSPATGSDFGGTGTGNGGGAGGGTNNNGGGTGDLGGGGNGGGGGTGGVDPKCASTTATADRLPLHMVIVLDRSGSMCEYTTSTNPRDANNPNSKWQQLRAGLSAFFASPDSKGITVSLVAFPSNNACNAGSYATMNASNVALPDTTALLGAVDAASPANLGCNANTPTTEAITGALQYADQVNTQLAGKGKVSVVMATDGEPQGCNSSVQSTANAAAGAASKIPTYVIGVGSSLNNLNQIAQSGGTTSAFIVSNSNPSAVGTQLTNALNTIRGNQLACEYNLPAPPQGKSLDLNTVNVQFTPGGGAAATLPYSKDCTGPGWHYDDPNAPKKIEICKASCDTIKADQAGKVDLVVGCATLGGVAK